jgi:hypothetical protein
MTSSRSSPVTTLCWVLIALSGVATLSTGLQLLVAFLFVRGTSDERLLRFPPVIRFMMENAPMITSGLFVLSFALLITAVFALQRRRWARVALIGELILVSLYCVAVPFVQDRVLAEFVERGIAPEVQSFADLIRMATIVVAVGTVAACAWIVKILMRADVKREFEGASR